jgi:hypothetical protein
MCRLSPKQLNKNIFHQIKHNQKTSIFSPIKGIALGKKN